MKKILKSVFATFCAGIAAFGLISCNSDTISAYDIAVKNGFTGTEQEWLLSLQGANGADGEDLDIKNLYSAAVEEGYEGSIYDFMEKYLNVEVQEDNAVPIIAENATSVVSIYCGFSTTQGGGMFHAPQTSYYSSAGSGVIIDLNKQAGSALIVTNYHVIYDSSSDTQTGISDNIYLYTYGALTQFSSQTGDVGGDGLKATYVGGAMDYDIALLKVEGSELLKSYAENGTARAADIGDSENVHIGEKVFAIGNPDGAGIAVTSGVISVESEYITMSSTDGRGSVDYRVIRTDAAINHGNSGGALFNAEGELIGITNAKNVDDEVDNMGYALPITQVKYICENIQDNGGVVKRAMLGVSVSTEASSATMTNGTLAITERFAVAEVAQQGSAAYNVLKLKDVFKWIVINDGARVDFTRQYQLNDLLLTVRKGDTVKLGVLRDGSEVTVTIAYDRDSYFTIYD